MSKCRRCGQTAYPTESTNYDNVAYHTTCFKCLGCNSALTPASIAQLNGKLYCKNCFTRMFKESGGTYANFRGRDEKDVPYFSTGAPEEPQETECWGCKTDLGDKRTLTAGGHKWHADCWKCENCGTPFFDGEKLGQSYTAGTKIVCATCAEDSSPCGGCGELINFKMSGGFLSALGKRWHQKCLGCAVCKKPSSKVQLIISKSGIPYCTNCPPPPDDGSFGSGRDGKGGGGGGSSSSGRERLCYGCKQNIEGSVHTAFKRDWHPDCFKCSECNLAFTARSSFLVRGEHAMCESCFEKTAPVCEECNIKLNSSDKGVTVFGKTWHVSCFVCNYCKKRLEDGRFKESPLRPEVPLCATCVGKVSE